MEKILSSKERINILEEIIYYENSFKVSEIAKKLKLSKGLISKYFNILKKEKVLSRKKNEFFVVDNKNSKSLKIMLNLNKFEDISFNKYNFVKAVGLYGSTTKGTNTESSDIDLWIKTINSNDEDLMNFLSEIRKKIKGIKILILNNKKVIKLKKEDSLFYNSLYFGSIILFGDINDIHN